jgi:hypothetical protein
VKLRPRSVSCQSVRTSFSLLLARLTQSVPRPELHEPAQDMPRRTSRFHREFFSLCAMNLARKPTWFRLASTADRNTHLLEKRSA